MSEQKVSELLRKRTDVLLRRSRGTITPEQAFTEIERDTRNAFDGLEQDHARLTAQVAELQEELEQHSENWRVKAGHLEQQRDELQKQLDARWQPISTAPKDGTNILALVPGSKSGILILHWGQQWLNNHYGFREGIWHSFPTHWMPLPAPPQETK